MEPYLFLKYCQLKNPGTNLLELPSAGIMGRRKDAEMPPLFQAIIFSEKRRGKRMQGRVQIWPSETARGSAEADRSFPVQCQYLLLIFA